MHSTLTVWVHWEPSIAQQLAFGYGYSPRCYVGSTTTWYGALALARLVRSELESGEWVRVTREVVSIDAESAK